MKVPLDAIKALREKTGAPLGDVRSALEAAGGNESKARELLKQKGFEAALKRADRAAGMGRVESYIHHDGRVGVLVEINCETDFVARLPEFQQFCREVAMQIASQQPATVQALLEQPFIKDSSQTIAQLLTALIAKTGENVIIRRFTRFGLGEDQGSARKA
jgi:elongation factor Ts